MAFRILLDKAFQTPYKFDFKVPTGLKGNSVQIGGGPAAVTPPPLPGEPVRPKRATVLRGAEWEGWCTGGGARRPALNDNAAKPSKNGETAQAYKGSSKLGATLQTVERIEGFLCFRD